MLNQSVIRRANNPIEGFLYAIRGFRLLGNSRVLPYAIIPVLITVCFFTLLFGYATHYVPVISAMMTQFLPVGFFFFGWFLSLILGLWLIIFSIYTFALITSFFAAPFCSVLSYEVEMLHTPDVIIVQTFWQYFKDIPRIFLRELRKFFYYIPRILLVMVLFFIPVVHFFSPLITLLFTAWMLCLQTLDYPMDNHQRDFDQVILFMWQHMSLCLGFGVGIVIIAAIPVANFFTLPAAVAGATLLYLESNESVGLSNTHEIE